MYEHRGRELHKREVTITGRLASMSRREAIRQIRSAGGRYADVPSDDTDFVVIGGDGPPLGPDGRPTYALRRARDLISIGAPITILEEADFVRMMKPQREAASLQHLYTIAQLSNILEEPVSKIRSWVRQGLIHPTKIEKRLCYFEFGQLSTARRLQQWIRSGITPARIQRSLAQIADWLGKPPSSLSDLEAISEDGTILVRLEDGRLADPNGQLLLDFHGAMKDHDAREAGCSMESGSVAVAAPPIHTLQPREETAEGWFRIGISAEENGQFDCASWFQSRVVP